MNESFHNIDHDRKVRLGFPEVIYGASKTFVQLKDILSEYVAKGKPALTTKLQKDKADQLLEIYPEAHYDVQSSIFMLGVDSNERIKNSVAIVSGGTSDTYVVNEIFYTLKFLGIGSERIMDVGVSGIQRLMSRVEDLKKFKVIIAVAGFEAALPTVLGGMMSQPIIAVPTSVGYGVSSDGQVALNCMLASCANGLTVVNIDNGYGAAIAAFRILQTFNKI
ncbi:MAG: NCAIR mutase (PurE)-related protein [Cyclobacteriaceae bacterium]|jgi:NCAIR mutase (PurE)-related protein